MKHFVKWKGHYPFIGPLRELQVFTVETRLNDLKIGNDGRDRTLLWAFGTKTARNAPSASAYVFGPAKWTRLNIAPPPGRVLIHRDYCQQEVRIAAVLSGDTELLAACKIGRRLSRHRPAARVSRRQHVRAEMKAVRTLFKTVVLGIQYGLGAKSLAIRTGISL